MSDLNSCLQNWYEPDHWLGDHRDDERPGARGTGRVGVVGRGAALHAPCGSPRPSKRTPRTRANQLYLGDGDLLVMGGAMPADARGMRPEAPQEMKENRGDASMTPFLHVAPNFKRAVVAARRTTPHLSSLLRRWTGTRWRRTMTRWRGHGPLDATFSRRRAGAKLVSYLDAMTWTRQKEPRPADQQRLRKALGLNAPLHQRKLFATPATQQLTSPSTAMYEVTVDIGQLLYYAAAAVATYYALQFSSILLPTGGEQVKVATRRWPSRRSRRRNLIY